MQNFQWQGHIRVVDLTNKQKASITVLRKKAQTKKTRPNKKYEKKSSSYMKKTSHKIMHFVYYKN